MRKTILMLIMGISVLSVYAQKESGTVYSEHEAIAKTKAMWAAFVKGDKEEFLSFFTDSVWNGTNGNITRISKQRFGFQMQWYNKEFANLSVSDDKPAFPDAIKYSNGEIFVQDWIRVTGTHIKSGINLNWPIHNLYHFDKDGKVDGISQYADFKIIEEINNSNKTIENGTVYMNHPYIVTVRKLINAWCAENIDSLRTFYAKNAVITDLSSKVGVVVSLEEKFNRNRKTFADLNNINLEQVGYPDCIYYAKEDYYIVYSWWSLSFKRNDGKEYSKIPVMLAHTFNKEGKISREDIYLSANLIE